MNTHSHAFFTFAALHNVEGAGLAVAGSVFPDALYYLAVPAIAARRGLSYRQAQTEVYRIPALRRMVDAIHAFPVLAVVALFAYWFYPPMLMFCLGWLSHLAIDFVTHGKGCHPHFWPILPFKFESPVSFYEEDRFGKQFMVVEHTLMAFILGYWWKTGMLSPEVLAGQLSHSGPLLLVMFAAATFVAYLVHVRQRASGAVRRGQGLVGALGIE
ncbi:MAG TPA: zinc dependent phospholipase C family protein [Stenomitos sp.]